jgi:hypothetical protein
VFEGLVGNIRNKITQKNGTSSSADVEDRLNGKLHLIEAHDGKITKNCAVCSNREVKGSRRETPVQGGKDSIPTSILPYII